MKLRDEYKDQKEMIELLIECNLALNKDKYEDLEQYYVQATEKRNEKKRTKKNKKQTS